MARPNIASVLKDEIARLARKEVRKEVDALKKANTSLRSKVAELSRQVADVQRALKSASRAKPAREMATSVESTNLRFSPSRLKTQREKLGLSAKAFGQLVGVSQLTVYNWEGGKSRPSADNLQAIVALRGIGKRQLQARLVAIGEN
jgi:DNA-binding transcriptional regulator YiaG